MDILTKEEIEMLIRVLSITSTKDLESARALIKIQDKLKESIEQAKE